MPCPWPPSNRSETDLQHSRLPCSWHLRSQLTAAPTRTAMACWTRRRSAAWPRSCRSRATTPPTSCGSQSCALLVGCCYSCARTAATMRGRSTNDGVRVRLRRLCGVQCVAVAVVRRRFLLITLFTLGTRSPGTSHILCTPYGFISLGLSITSLARLFLTEYHFCELILCPLHRRHNFSSLRLGYRIALSHFVRMMY